MPDSPTNWYPSKIDWWLASILLAPPVVLAALAAYTLFVEGHPIRPALVVPAGLLVALYRLCVFPIRYAVGNTNLDVRFGLLRRSVPLADIVSVRRTRNPLSSPALSLDRLEVKYGDGWFKRVLISPADRLGFLAELAAKAGLTADGDGLTRRRD